MDINGFFKQLDGYFEQGKIKEVEDFLESQYKQACDLKDENAQLSILNEMIGYYRSVSNFKKAIQYSEVAIAKMKNLGLGSSIAYGTTLLNAATAYRTAGELEKARALFEETMQIFEFLLPENDYRLAGLYNNISALYEQQGRCQPAAAMLDRALKILKTLPNCTIETAVVQTNQALLYFKMCQDKEAMETLAPALELYAKVMDKPGAESDPHYASALAGLAEGCLRMKMYARAAEVYEMALLEIEKKYGKNKDYYITCKNCAIAYNAMGEKQKAKQLEDLPLNHN